MLLMSKISQKFVDDDNNDRDDTCKQTLGVFLYSKASSKLG